MINSAKSFLDNISIAKKTILLIIIITLGTLIVGASAHFGVKSIKENYDTSFKTNFIPVKKLQECRDLYTINLKQNIDIKEKAFDKWKEFLEIYYKNKNTNDKYLQSLIDKAQKEIVELNNILNKADTTNKISNDLIIKLDNTFSKIINHYFDEVKKGYENSNKLYSSTKYIVIALTIVVMLISLLLSLLISKNFHKILQNLSDIIEKTNEENIKIQNSIIQKVDTAVKEAREKDQIMYQNARLASMGEMIGNIAHQWRQPLNALTLLIQSFGTKSLTGNLDKEFIDKQVEEGLRLAISMSNTIEDFRNFFSTHREKEYFDLKKAIEDTLDMSSFFCKDENIEISVDAKDDIKVFGYSNEFSQVLLNLINNARENFKHKNIQENKKIFISLKKEGGKITLEFIDNGGGIEESIIDRIFEPYFTTKHKSIGTGIGLYMSKQIIETQMGGQIEAQNIQKEFDEKIYKCAKFTISFPAS